MEMILLITNIQEITYYDSYYPQRISSQIGYRSTQADGRASPLTSIGFSNLILFILSFRGNK